MRDCRSIDGRLARDIEIQPSDERQSNEGERRKIDMIRGIPDAIRDSPHGESPSGERGGRRRLGTVGPVDGLASEGLHRPGHGPEGLLASLGEHAAVSDSIVEVTAAAAAMETVPSSHGAPGDATMMTAAILATWTAKLAGVLVHLLSVIPSPRGTRFLLCRHDRVRVTCLQARRRGDLRNPCCWIPLVESFGFASRTSIAHSEADFIASRRDPEAER